MVIIATYFFTLVVFLVIGMGSYQLRGTWRRLRKEHEIDEHAPA